MRHNYDYIPQPILVFKNKQIIYANEQIKSTFLVDSLEFLSLKLRDILNFKSEDQLFDFLVQNSSFEYNNQTITTKYVQKEYDLFLFDTIHEIRKHETNHPVLEQVTGSHIDVISFFRGIKLQSTEKILQIQGDAITLHISKKQQLNLYDNREFFIRVKDEYYSTRCTSYEIGSDTIVLDNITPVSHHTLDRNEVRLQVDCSNIYLPYIEQELELHDISEKSISFNSNELCEETELKKITSLNLPFLPIAIPVTYFKTTNQGDKNHYIFLIDETPNQLTEFIHERQRKILLEFTNTLHKI